MSKTDPPFYQVKILPGLRRIQEAHGYLEPEEMKRFSEQSGIPLHRLQEVGSFFPHFQSTPPPRVKVRVCRDMACHMAGSPQIRQQLAKLAGDGIVVEGASCLGRCDRAPAAIIEVFGQPTAHQEGEPHHATSELFYHGHTADELQSIAIKCLQGTPPPEDRDAARPYPAADWQIDIYKGKQSDYQAVRKAVELRDASLLKTALQLESQPGWSRERAEQFRQAAKRRMAEPPEEVRDAVLAWQTSTDWADDLIKQMDNAHADLRGLGGAGWPATLKWRDVREAVRVVRARRADDRAFVVVNGDESEPGTFKDREILLRSPHLVLEGVILGAMVTDASQGFIFIRHEYPEQIKACEEEIRRAEALGVCGPFASVLGRPFPVSVFVSPGGYILGEQSALLEAMSDRRGEPRNVPPLLNTNGLDDQPTLLSNVETFAWVPYIWVRGGQAYADLGLNSWRGRRYFSVCGDVVRPGVYEIPNGLPFRELVYGENYCRGIVGGKKIKAIAPSGPSSGFLPPVLKAGAGLPANHVNNKMWQELAQRRGFDPGAQEIDLMNMELDLGLFRALSPTGAIGGGVVIYAEGRDMAEQVVNALEFYRNESCGKCVPCRIGSQKMAALGGHLLGGKIEAGRWKSELLPLVKELVDTINMTSICGLGRSIPTPVRTLIEFFGEDLNRHLQGGR